MVNKNDKYFIITGTSSMVHDEQVFSRVKKRELRSVKSRIRLDLGKKIKADQAKRT